MLKDQYFDLINANKLKISNVSSSMENSYTYDSDKAQVRGVESVIQRCDADFDALLALCRKMKKSAWIVVQAKEQCDWDYDSSDDDNDFEAHVSSTDEDIFCVFSENDEEYS